MAPANAASVNGDSIKGLARSLAKPAYRRLLTAEPVLRRAVPVLIFVFLCSIAFGAILQVLDQRQHAIAAAVRDIEAIADLVGERLDRDAPQNRTSNDGISSPMQDQLERAL